MSYIYPWSFQSSYSFVSFFSSWPVSLFHRSRSLCKSIISLLLFSLCAWVSIQPKENTFLHLLILRADIIFLLIRVVVVVTDRDTRLELKRFLISSSRGVNCKVAVSRFRLDRILPVFKCALALSHDQPMEKKCNGCNSRTLLAVGKPVMCIVIVVCSDWGVYTLIKLTGTINTKSIWEIVKNVLRRGRRVYEW